MTEPLRNTWNMNSCQRQKAHPTLRAVSKAYSEVDLSQFSESGVRFLWDDEQGELLTSKVHRAPEADGERSNAGDRETTRAPGRASARRIRGSCFLLGSDVTPESERTARRAPPT